jgi:hypothetical protein
LNFIFQVNKISQIPEMANMDNCLAIFPEIMQKCCQPICMTWLEKELHLKESDTNKVVWETKCVALYFVIISMLDEMPLLFPTLSGTRLSDIGKVKRG